MRYLVSWCNLVSTLDFESKDPGSNPGETFCHGSSVGQSARLLTVWSWVQVPLVTHSSIAQLAERSAVNRQVAGSSPAGGVRLITLSNPVRKSILSLQFFIIILLGFPSLVKGERLKTACYTLRGFKSPLQHFGFVVKLVITVDFESTIPGSSPGETSVWVSKWSKEPV